MKTNKKPSYTPGPWHYDAHDDEADVLSDYGQVARVFGSSEHDGSAKDEEGEANAHLIAAAPDLLAALKAVFDEADGGWKREHPTAALVRAAIARAEGA